MSKIRVLIDKDAQRAVIKRKRFILIEFRLNKEKDIYDINFKDPAAETKFLKTEEGRYVLEVVLRLLIEYKSRVEQAEFWRKSIQDNAATELKYFLKKSPL